MGSEGGGDGRGKAEAGRLATLRRALGELHRAFGLGFAFELWDGTRVPEDGPEDGPRIAITTPAALTRLVRRPRAATLVELYAAGAIDLRGGDLFDLAALAGGRRARKRGRTLRPLLLLGRALLPFLFARGSEGGVEAGLDGGREATRGRGSARADIAFHYDVSNRFYGLFLDPAMVYTCAYFRDWSNDLATAQQDKLELICRKLRLKPGDRLLDIGCGWGALVCHAAEHHGVRALGVTLSEQQVEVARQRIAARGLADRVEVRLQDFREVDGRFDKVASIGMFEHVGIANHAAYFRKVRSLLVPGGLYLHHAIARRGKATDRSFRRKRPEYAAIIRYIFPGAELDHLAMSIRNLESGGFEVHDVEAWREHYAHTTELWARRLMANREAAVAEVGEARYRLWVLYLSGVSIAFARGTLQIFQTLTSRRARGPSGLPPTREDLYR